MGELIVLALWLCPPGKPTIYTPGSLAMRTLPLGCRDKNGAGFIADRASESLTVSTLGSFISFFYITHTITSKNSYYDKKNAILISTQFFFIAIRQPITPQTPSATTGRIPDEGDWGGVVG